MDSVLSSCSKRKTNVRFWAMSHCSRKQEWGINKSLISESSHRRVDVRKHTTLLYSALWLGFSHRVVVYISQRILSPNEVSQSSFVQSLKLQKTNGWTLIWSVLSSDPARGHAVLWTEQTDLGSKRTDHRPFGPRQAQFPPEVWKEGPCVCKVIVISL